MQELWLCVTPWRVSLSYEYTLIHLTCMFTGWSVGPSNLVLSWRIKSCQILVVLKRICLTSNPEASLWFSSIQQQKPLILPWTQIVTNVRDHLWNFKAFINGDCGEIWASFQGVQQVHLWVHFHIATQLKNQYCLWFFYLKHDQEWISCFLCFDWHSKAPT